MLTRVREVLDRAAAFGRVETLVEVGGHAVRAVTFGTDAPDAPALIVVGGVHGLERIGTAVATAYIQMIVAQLGWDDILRHALTRCRIAVLPLLNPVGMARGTRSNGAGVDLMRNAPEPFALGTPLVGGQTWSRRLPWYMGRTLQPEAAALIDFVERTAFSAPIAIALDLHSGFGLVDRLWYPYARTRAPLPDLAAIRALVRLLDDTLPNHVYRVEPTAQVYTIRGDLWDHLYDLRRARGGGILLPLTLEMGSWTWVRKNPRQLLSRDGRWNPVAPHRERRTLRRHLLLLDFLFRASIAYPRWIAQ